MHSVDIRLLVDPIWIQFVLGQTNCGNKIERFTFGDLCDFGVCNANVRDPLQVRKSIGLDSCTLQRIGPEL